jgi:hypothetical protein
LIRAARGIVLGTPHLLRVHDGDYLSRQRLDLSAVNLLSRAETLPPAVDDAET